MECIFVFQKPRQKHSFSRGNSCKDGYARISQQEIAERVKLSRVTVNKHFQYLIYAGYIIPDDQYLSKYKLSDNAIEAAKQMKKSLTRKGITQW